MKKKIDIYYIQRSPKEHKLKENKLGRIFAAYIDKYKEHLQKRKRQSNRKKEKVRDT